ncbi:hypothetical protein [Curvibacter phage PCA1]|nr:hypothetical protein [Curvibacter phage PCA1]
MSNAYKLLRDLIPEAPLLVGTVTAYANGVVTLETPGGGTDQARGDAAVNDRVFYRDGVIEGPAPTLPLELIEI